MRRAITALLVTVVVVVLLANFKTQAPALTAANPSAKRSAPASTATTGSSSSSGTNGSSGSSSTTHSATATATGTAISTQYGTVQVKVTKANGKITAITPVTLTANDQRSQEIDAQAEPILRQEALQAQSASIDAVSGATYTSDAYVQSLQAALDRVSGQSTSS